MQRPSGFTVVELLVVVAIIGTIAAIGVPAYLIAIERATIGAAITEIYGLQKEIAIFQINVGKLPDTLEELGRTSILDPWGNPYRYLNFATVQGKGKMRKDRFLVPINSSYDIQHGQGRQEPDTADGQSQPG